LLDLKMDAMDGIETYREIKKINENLPIIIFSAFTHELPYREQMKEISPTATLEKPLPLKSTPEYEASMDIIKKARLEHKIRHANPFFISYDDYLNMDPSLIVEFHRRVSLEHKDWIDENLQNRKAQWMIVCGGKIVKFSKDPDEYPAKAELQELGKKHNRIPFVFFELPVVEEYDWQKIHDNDYYPTLKICTPSHDNSNECVVDFDTGSNRTIFDLSGLKKKTIVSIDHFDFPMFAKHLDKEFRYYQIRINLEIVDQKGINKARELTCFAVDDWRNSPFVKVNPDRIGLAGRDILRKFSLIVALDSLNKKTKVYHKSTDRKIITIIFSPIKNLFEKIPHT